MGTFVTDHDVASLTAPSAKHVEALLILGPLAVVVIVLARLANDNAEHGVTENT